METNDDKMLNVSKEELEKAKKSLKDLIYGVSAFSLGCIRATVFMYIADAIGLWLGLFRLNDWQATFFLWAPLVVILGLVGSIIVIAYVSVFFIAFKEFIKGIFRQFSAGFLKGKEK